VIFLDDILQSTDSPLARKFAEDCRVMRVHNDVIELAGGIVHDEDKLKAAAPFIFLPAYRTWMEWEDNHGKLAMFFDGRGDSVTQGHGIFLSKRHEDDANDVVSIPFTYDLEAYLVETINAPKFVIPDDLRAKYDQAIPTLKPIVFAILALINSPKIIRSTAVDLSKLNKRREAQGRYTFHPHHEVRLNVDKRVIKTVAGESDGASKCLHFVRTHLRFVPSQGGYTMVMPHWRGDPALGIRDTHYNVDRERSKWPEPA
jgi:hypothetical protein